MSTTIRIQILAKPILGESADIQAPIHATLVADVANDALNAIVNNAGIIVTPDAEKRYWNLYPVDWG
ncbi:hypothetical protein GCM10007916_12540 [Psychromonas marina]|uniref:Uncharacterized protein n=1 Tax=Psychromonas marina TaxID=88364 RepID=A0ABQ6DYF1_9GAMM|nr:hypothetical protein GCM10007916_12540 [Psychromonas marina]